MTPSEKCAEWQRKFKEKNGISYHQYWRRKNPERYREMKRASRQRNSEKRNATRRAWAAKNREYMAQKGREWHERYVAKHGMSYYEANKEQSIIQHRTRYLRTKYGVSPEWYDKKMRAQGDVCAICGGVQVRQVRGGGIKPLCVDHDHATSELRGLLCDACNEGIAKFQDDPNILRSAIKYLKKYQRHGLLSLMTGEMGGHRNQ